MSDYVAISRIERKLDRILKIIDTPVDEYVPVKREVWEGVTDMLDEIHYDAKTLNDAQIVVRKLRRALAEIETLGDGLTDRQSFGLTQEVEDE